MQICISLKRVSVPELLCHTPGLLDLEVREKQQEGCTCVAHQASSPKQDVPTIKQAEDLGGCRVSVPVLRTFLMTTATCPFSMELSSLTMRMRQVQRMSSDIARRMRPTARSGRLVLLKRCLPAGDGHREDQHLGVHSVLKM